MCYALSALPIASLSSARELKAAGTIWLQATETLLTKLGFYENLRNWFLVFALSAFSFRL